MTAQFFIEHYARHVNTCCCGLSLFHHRGSHRVCMSLLPASRTCRLCFSQHSPVVKNNGRTCSCQEKKSLTPLVWRRAGILSSSCDLCEKKIEFMASSWSEQSPFTAGEAGFGQRMRRRRSSRRRVVACSFRFPHVHTLLFCGGLLWKHKKTSSCVTFMLHLNRNCNLENKCEISYEWLRQLVGSSIMYVAATVARKHKHVLK